ncbi:MAG: type II secretion system protein [Candidatus Sungbacteria bacterium]|uniref:Type II secretion system protein n=1 Tax=Candidatus Sungiibacteriota bacterium TaxID=2750080 RepID=A0A931WPC2_9BACT|nr:type II secretion system protein [Candidatus Sungbacteria bacterium]
MPAESQGQRALSALAPLLEGPVVLPRSGQTRLPGIMSRGQVTGFTLVEVLVTLAALAILGTIVLGAFSRFRTSAQLDGAVRQILSTLRLAQSKTLASETSYQYGVRIETDHIILFRGAVYTASSTNETTDFPSGVVASNVSLAGGGIDVIFDRLTGNTSESGSVTLTAGGGPQSTQVITVEPSGQARAAADALPPTLGRLIDTRHVNFALGWSIQGATTLRLQFLNPPNPDTIEDIVMEGYFDGGQTVFDWSGTVAVNGSNQRLRIHSISIDFSATTLSIDRDRRTNDKGVIILIDGKEIARYDSAGNVTVGPFGGIMTIQ